jgi:hypothetical protein
MLRSVNKRHCALWLQAVGVNVPLALLVEATEQLVHFAPMRSISASMSSWGNTWVKCGAT